MPFADHSHVPIESAAGPRGLTALFRSVFASGLGRNAGLTLVLRGSYCVLEFLCSLAIARAFHASGYGVYALAVSWVMVLAIPAAAGFDRVVLREIGVHRARDEWSLVHGILKRSRHVVLVVSIALALAVAGAMPLLAHSAARAVYPDFPQYDTIESRRSRDGEQHHPRDSQGVDSVAGRLERPCNSKAA